MAYAVSKCDYITQLRIFQNLWLLKFDHSVDLTAMEAFVEDNGFPRNVYKPENSTEAALEEQYLMDLCEEYDLDIRGLRITQRIASLMDEAFDKSNAQMFFIKDSLMDQQNQSEQKS